MGFVFKKKEPVMKYSQIEQGTTKPELPDIPVPPPTPLIELKEQLEKVLNNQKTIVENQQVILNAIGGTQELIKSLATTEQPEEVEEEPTEEEVAEALAEIKKKKGMTTKRGMPKGGWPKKGK